MDCTGFLSGIQVGCNKSVQTPIPKNVCSTSVRCRTPCRMMVGAAPVKEKVLEKKSKVETERQTKQPDMYRLYIYNDPINKRERVVDVLLKTCQGLTFSRAYSAMQEAHENGRGLVLVIAQEIAEHYCSVINSGKQIELKLS